MIVPSEALRRFTVEVFARGGMSDAHAGIVADALVWANLRGMDSHGVARVPSYSDSLLDSGAGRPSLLRGQPGSFQPSQLQRARPMISSLSFAESHGSSSVNIVTQCFHEHGMRVMSVPQNMRSGPKAS